MIHLQKVQNRSNYQTGQNSSSFGGQGGDREGGEASVWVLETFCILS